MLPPFPALAASPWCPGLLARPHRLRPTMHAPQRRTVCMRQLLAAIAAMMRLRVMLAPSMPSLLRNGKTALMRGEAARRMRTAYHPWHCIWTLMNWCSATQSCVRGRFRRGSGGALMVRCRGTCAHASQPMVSRRGLAHLNHSIEVTELCDGMRCCSSRHCAAAGAASFGVHRFSAAAAQARGLDRRARECACIGVPIVAVRVESSSCAAERTGLCVHIDIDQQDRSLGGEDLQVKLHLPKRNTCTCTKEF